jgi:hypothetical protein
MSKNEKIFRVIAVAGLITGVISLIRRETEIKYLNKTYYMMRQHFDDLEFAEIIERYEEEDN